MHHRRAAWFVSNRCFNISRAREELGYRPQVSIEDGIHEMVKSFEQAGWM
jgi:nucleoside-diphosphate-sugar epimerase